MKWTVGAKIGTGFAATSVIFLVVGVVAYRNLTQSRQTADLVNHTHKVLAELASLRQSITEAESGARGYVIAGEESYLEPYLTGIKDFERHLSELRALTKDNPQQQQRLKEMESSARRRLSFLATAVEMQRTKNTDGARAEVISGRGREEMDRFRDLESQIEAAENDLLTERDREARASAGATRTVILAGTGAAVVLSAAIGYFLSVGIARPLREITSLTERVATGDLTADLPTTPREDEVGQLVQTNRQMIASLRSMADTATRIADGDLTVQVKPQSDKDVLGRAFVTMVNNLRAIALQITEGVNTLSSSTNQISTTTTQLASSAAQTASAVTETTTTVEEVRQTSQMASQKAKYVSDSTAKAAQISQDGRKSVEMTAEEILRVRKQMESIAEGMVRLSEQSKSVGTIIATVDDLSAQSNILAVNAAIEAAKAGEYGKGFAVVAQEVRSLAEQSKQATAQVRAILNDIQKATNAAVMMTEQGAKAVEVGVKQSGEAGQSIQLLAGSVTEAAQAATQIAASSQQQLVGMEQVATAMESIKQASAQNVSSAKQLESAAHSLKDLGQKLKFAVGRYKL